MPERDSSSGVTGGVGLGAVLAITISWSVNHSILWAILHGICNWLYVVYWYFWGVNPWA